MLCSKNKVIFSSSSKLKTRQMCLDQHDFQNLILSHNFTKQKDRWLFNLALVVIIELPKTRIDLPVLVVL